MFNLKLNDLLDHIKAGYFGAYEALIHTIEFQKRGLPHAHILLILKQDSKPRPDTYDKFVSAELPDPETQPELYALVSKHMMHGPCGTICMEDGKCKKKFPKWYVVDL